MSKMTIRLKEEIENAVYQHSLKHDIPMQNITLNIYMKKGCFSVPYDCSDINDTCIVTQVNYDTTCVIPFSKIERIEIKHN